MKEARKTGNINIRDTSKRTSRDENSSHVTKSRTSMGTGPKKWMKSDNSIDFQMQKQLVLAENLTEQQQKQIVKQAQRAVSKKIKSSETKIQNDMASLLEVECNRVGQELQNEKANNIKLRIEVGQLRKNIDFLNRKFQGVFKEHESLSKNNDYGRMEKEQIKEELQRMKSVMKRKQDQFDYHYSNFQTQAEKLKKDLADRDENIQSLLRDNQNLRGENEELTEELQEKTNQAQYLRQNFQQKKKEWDRLKQDFESNSRQHLEKKGEKITKYQVDLQSLNDKLREEQGTRKKVVERNKQVEKDIIRKTEAMKDLQEQISALKKRVNDLSILKSSNNTIMNQKIAKLAEENEKLKRLIDQLKGRKPQRSEEEKPYLFGPEEFD